MMQAIIAQPARLAQANLSKMARLLAALRDKKADEPQAVDVAANDDGSSDAAATDHTAAADDSTVAADAGTSDD
jgi:hypothetical protein